MNVIGYDGAAVGLSASEVDVLSSMEALPEGMDAVAADEGDELFETVFDGHSEVRLSCRKVGL